MKTVGIHVHFSHLVDIVLQFSFTFLTHRQLGTDNKFLDKQSKINLLDFSLCHCPVEEIQIILRERKVLHAKV